ncbi:MAG TPA: hypothetical protein VFY23_03390 [Candidatus Limnocylindrales bacterium]|nr:hypothetical protein [Candidatus Limnocylindrales bacterium]
MSERITAGDSPSPSLGAVRPPRDLRERRRVDPEPVVRFVPEDDGVRRVATG